GNVYIADSGNSRIRMVTPAGVISTVAGDGRHGFAGEGAKAENARFSATPPSTAMADPPSQLVSPIHGAFRWIRAVSSTSLIPPTIGAEKSISGGVSHALPGN